MLSGSFPIGLNEARCIHVMELVVRILTYRHPEKNAQGWMHVNLR